MLIQGLKKRKVHIAGKCFYVVKNLQNKKREFQFAGWKNGRVALAQSPILVTTITLNRLQKKGYESMLDYYLKVAPQFNEPLYARPA